MLCFKHNAVDDYEVPVPSQLVFGVGMSSLCTDITTTDDGVYERNESISLTLASEDENIDVSGNSTTVSIIDNDGMKTTLSLFTSTNCCPPKLS